MGGRARILDGKRVAAELRGAVARETAASGLRPGLAVVLVGDDPASRVYVRNKTRALAEAGMEGSNTAFPTTPARRRCLNSSLPSTRTRRWTGFSCSCRCPRA